MRRLVVSFPKSGRTWLRYGLHLAGHPDIPFTHDGCEYNDGAKPALDFDPAHRIGKYRKFDRIVYVKRDPRDTIVSLFHQVTGRFDDFFHYKGDISSFIRDPYFGVHNLLSFRAMWDSLAGELPVLTITYEEMSRDYIEVFRQVSSHFDLEVTADQYRSISAGTAFSAMREVERARNFEHAWMRPRLGAPKVRKGKVGGYADELSADDILYIEDIMSGSGGHLQGAACRM